MPRPRTLKHTYCVHKSSGRAFVKLGGKFVYLGKYGSQESKDLYDRLIGEWIADAGTRADGAGNRRCVLASERGSRQPA